MDHPKAHSSRNIPGHFYDGKRQVQFERRDSTHGEPEAVLEIRKADSPYKARIALSSPVFGYAMGQFAADWLNGKRIPQAMDILPISLTRANLEQYNADLLDPASVHADPASRDHYLKMYGNICFDSRNEYVNFPWSSELK